MFVTLSPTFAEGTKIIFAFNSVVPLSHHHAEFTVMGCNNSNSNSISNSSTKVPMPRFKNDLYDKTFFSFGMKNIQINIHTSKMIVRLEANP